MVARFRISLQLPALGELCLDSLLFVGMEHLLRQLADAGLPYFDRECAFAFDEYYNGLAFLRIVVQN